MIWSFIWSNHLSEFSTENLISLCPIIVRKPRYFKIYRCRCRYTDDKYIYVVNDEEAEYSWKKVIAIYLYIYIYI